MYASKENCRKAKEMVSRADAEAVIFVRDFLVAVEKKLPTNEECIREEERDKRNREVDEAVKKGFNTHKTDSNR